MAKVTSAGVVGSMSGRLGNLVVAQTVGGPVLRERPMRTGEPSSAQLKQYARMAYVNAQWDQLTPAQAEAWRAYAQSLAERDPVTGRTKTPAAFQTFTALSTKYLQIHGGGAIPLDPPSGRYVGESIELNVQGGAHSLTFTATGPNRAGVQTEILVQRLSGPHNAARPKSYTSVGFFTLTGSSPTVEIDLPFGYYATAYRFVETSSGRMTPIYLAGRGNVTEHPLEEVA